jgi:hypothetical protein
MPPKSNRGFLVSAAFMATLALPSAAFSQQRLPTITSIASPDSVHASAVAMTQDFKQWRQAATLHRQSAAMRQPDDSMGYRCLTTAARLSYGINDATSAQSDMAAAAAQAMSRGDVEKAAQAYADAAWLADARKDPEQARAFAQQAEVLASSPLLSSRQRDGILRRFVHTAPTGPELAAQAPR